MREVYTQRERPSFSSINIPIEAIPNMVVSPEFLEIRGKKR